MKKKLEWIVLTLAIGTLLGWVDALSSVQIRKLDTIGIVRDSCGYHGGLVVLSDSHTIALIGASGDSLWRNPLAPAETPRKLSCYGEESFLLSTVHSNWQASFGLMRSVSAATGDIIWEISLPPSLVEFSASDSYELSFDEQRKSITVLLQGTVHIIEITAAGPALWTPSINGGEPSKQIAFSKLVTQFELDAPIAVGCVLDGEGVCEEAVTLSVDLLAHTTQLDRYSAMALGATLRSLDAFVERRDGRACKAAVAWYTEGSLLTWQQSSLCAPMLEASMQLPPGTLILSTKGVMQGFEPALLLCVRDSSGRRLCGLVSAHEMAGAHSLHAQGNWLGPLSEQIVCRVPLWGQIAPRFLSILRSSSAAADREGIEEGELLLWAPEQQLSSLAEPLYLATMGPSQLLLVDRDGLAMGLGVSAGSCELPGGVIWARNEALTRTRMAFLLSPSPSISPASLVKEEEAEFSWQEWLLGARAHQQHGGTAILLNHASLHEGAVAAEELGLSVQGLGLAAEHADWLVSLQLPRGRMVRHVTAVALHWPPHSPDSLDSRSNAVLVIADCDIGAALWLLEGESGLALSSLSGSPSPRTFSLQLATLRYSQLHPCDHLPASLGELLYISASSQSFSMVFRPSSESEELLELRPELPGAAASSPYLHTLHRASGRLIVFQLDDVTPCSGFELEQRGLRCRRAFPISEAVLGAVKAVAYADPRDASLSQSVSALGDDSLLKKYLNPNLLLLCTTQAGQEEGMAVQLLDVASGRLLKRLQVEQASSPVQALLLENLLLIAYWNPSAKRSELLVSALYEGFIGKHELTPGWRSLPQLLSPHPLQQLRSSFSTPQLMSVEKTFALPRAVSSLQRTLSAKGISHKNLLLALDSGELMSLDLRLVHPRRPLTDPTPAEKEEGLQRYLPLLALNPVQALTGDELMEGSGRLLTLALPSGLESTCTLLLYGQGGSRGVRVLTHLPAQGFDTLAQDFNRSSLLLLLSALALVVVMLRLWHSKNTLRKLWL